MQAFYLCALLKYLTYRRFERLFLRKFGFYGVTGEVEMKPESLGAIGLAAREGLITWTFVINL